MNVDVSADSPTSLAVVEDMNVSFPAWIAQLSADERAAVRLVPVAGLAVHPACEFSPFYAKSYERVRSSVAKRNILFPLAVVGADDRVVDGRYRLRAARELGIASVPVLSIAIDAHDKAEVAAWAWEAKEAREHLDENERAVLAVQYQRFLRDRNVKVRAKKAAAGRLNRASSGETAKPFVAAVPKAKVDSRKEACAVHKVSERKIRAMTRLAEDRPDLFKKILAGELDAGEAIKQKGKNVDVARVAAAVASVVRPEDIVDGECENRIHVGEAVDVLRRVPDGLASLVMFSPPYYGVPIPYEPPLPIQTYDEYLDGLRDVLAESFRVSRTGGRLAVIVDTPHNPDAGGDADEMLPVFADVTCIARSCGWRFWVDLAWTKPEVTGSKVTYGSLGRCSAPGWGRDHELVLVFFKPPKKLHGDVALSDLDRKDHVDWHRTTWAITGETRAEILAAHPAPMPEALAERLIKLLTHRRDLVIDPMCGSGTTTTVAASLGRRYIGIDRSPSYCAFAAQRVRRVGVDDRADRGEQPVVTEINVADRDEVAA